jgi:hypothetical protein
MQFLTPPELREHLPAREPANSEVAAGAVAGLLAGITGWLPAMVFARPGEGALMPLRLVAATFLGMAALDDVNVAVPTVVGAFVAGIIAVTFGLVFVSILPDGAGTGRSVTVGAVYGAVLFFPSWYLLVQVMNPVLFLDGRPWLRFGMHVLYGVVLGLLVPILRKIFP